MPLDLTDDKSTLVQVMAWCHQATSHYLNQCWPRSTSPNGATRPQWVIKHWNTFSCLLVLRYRGVPLPLTNVLSSYDDQYTAPNSEDTGGESPTPPPNPQPHLPQMEVSDPYPCKCRSDPPSPKNVLSSFAQDILSCESEWVSIKFKGLRTSNGGHQGPYKSI